jgi:phage terminase large subunit-like protein
MIQTPSPLRHYKTLQEYFDFAERLKKFKDEAEKVKLMRLLCRTDLFWLLWFGCGKGYIAKQWLLDRCKEVEANPDGHLDLWAREHFKSTIITYGVSIKNILASHGDDPLPEWERETTIGILSVTRPLAKGFLREIKETFESNKTLKTLFPDILYDKPQTQSTKWSEEVGICVKRKKVYKEQTVEAWGLVDGQPTGKHFYEINYDDVVTQDSVTNPEMIQKTTAAFGLSDNIGTRGGKYRVVGTPYHANDTLATIIEKGAFKLRKHPGTFGGKWPIDNDNEAPLLTKAELELKYIKQGVYNFSCQILLNPVASSLQNFKLEWLRHFGTFNHDYQLAANFYIIVDPANSKKDAADYTSMVVIACCSDDNYYLVDMVRDRLNLKERTEKLFALHKKWKPVAVGYEQYGLQSDIEHIESVMSQYNYHFNIIRLGAGKGAKLSKIERISKLQPVFQQRRFLLPFRIHYVDYQGHIHNLVDVFIKEEYLSFPVAKHDDILDSIARILDVDMLAFFPQTEEYVYNPDNDLPVTMQNRNETTGY